MNTNRRSLRPRANRTEGEQDREQQHGQRESAERAAPPRLTNGRRRHGDGPDDLAIVLVFERHQCRPIPPQHAALAAAQRRHGGCAERAGGGADQRRRAAIHLKAIVEDLLLACGNRPIAHRRDVRIDQTTNPRFRFHFRRELIVVTDADNFVAQAESKQRFCHVRHHGNDSLWRTLS